MLKEKTAADGATQRMHKEFEKADTKYLKSQTYFGSQIPQIPQIGTDFYG